MAVDLFNQVGPHGDFLPTAHTLKWFRRDQFIPSELIDRKDHQQWTQGGSQTIVDRAKKRVIEILAEHVHTPIPEEGNQQLKQIMRNAAKQARVTYLPHDL